MSAGITRKDTFVGYKLGGWHGLGKTFSEKITSKKEAYEKSGLNWMVEQYQMAVTDVRAGLKVADSIDFHPKLVESHIMNIRSDTGDRLGVVGAGWVPMQNSELFDLMWSVAEGSKDTLHLETAGSLHGGKRVWVLLAGVKFDAGGNSNDPINTYLLGANGHDGGLALWLQPTSTRVVCQNTLHVALSTRQRHIRLRHTGDWAMKTDEIKNVLKLHGAAVDGFKKQVAVLDAKDITKEEAQQFFIDAYTKTEYAIPGKDAKEKEDVRKRERAMDAYNMFVANVDADVSKTHAKRRTLWNVFNAYTEWQQHQRPVRAADEGKRLEARAYNDLFGSIGQMKQEVFELAVSRI